jgi:hypothetical protein
VLDEFVRAGCRGVRSRRADQGELPEEFAAVAVHDPDVEVVDEQGDAGAGVWASDADGVEPALVAQVIFPLSRIWTRWS